MPRTFNEILRAAVEVKLDKRDGLPEDQYDPYITLVMPDGEEFYISQDGMGGIQFGNGSAA